MDMNENILLVLPARTAAYRCLQAVFEGEPTLEVVTLLSSAEFFQVVSLFSLQKAQPGGLGAADDTGTDDSLDASGRLLESLETLSAAAEQIVSAGEDAIDALGGAYCRLFLGPNHPEAAPWESTYLDNEKTLFRASTIAVRKAYLEQNLIPSRYPQVADDHIALELDFMSLLAQRAEKAVADGDAETFARSIEASKRFLDQHLLVWTPSFRSTLEKSAHATLYFEAACVVEAFAQADRMLLDEVSIDQNGGAFRDVLQNRTKQHVGAVAATETCNSNI